MNNSVWVCSLVLLIPPFLSQISAVVVWPFLSGGRDSSPSILPTFYIAKNLNTLRKCFNALPAYIFNLL